MEKIPKPQVFELPPVSLYLDDIETLISIFQESSNLINIIIDEHLLISFKELEEIDKDLITNFEIISRDPSIALRAASHSVFVTSWGDDIVSIGTLEKLRKSLDDRKVWLARIFKSPRYTFSIMMASAFFAVVLMVISIVQIIQLLIIGLSSITESRSEDSIIVSMVTATVFLGVAWIFDTTYRNSIVLQRRIKAPSFWQRNKDKLIIALITALLSFISGYLLALVTGRIP